MSLRFERCRARMSQNPLVVISPSLAPFLSRIVLMTSVWPWRSWLTFAASISLSLNTSSTLDDLSRCVEEVFKLSEIDAAKVSQRRMSLGPRHLAGLFIDGDEVHKSTSNINGDS